jgi:O-antigen ligase
MNDLSTSKPSKSQSSWRSLPWGTFLFLLVIFVYSTPLWWFNWGLGTAISVVDTSGVSDILGQDNWMRIIALIALGAFALFNLLRSKKGRFQINGLLGWLILFYLVWAAFSIIWSIDPRFTLKRVGILIILSLGALYVAERLSLQETIALVLFICAVSVLLGLVIALATNNFYPFTGWWRFGGNMHPIAQAWHIGLLLLSALAFAKTAEQKRAVYIGIALIAFLFLLLTRSRMAFISCVMASGLYWSMTTPKRHQSVLIFLGIIIVGCSAFILLGNLLFIQLGEKAITLGRGELGLQSMQSLTGRRPLWNALSELINQRPFAGYGYEAFLTGQNLQLITENLNWAAPNTHSGYISTLGGLGYIGFITFLLILILSLTMSINLFRQNRDYAFIVAVLVWLIFNLFTEDQLLTRPYFPVFVWMIMLARLGFIREKS